LDSDLSEMNEMKWFALETKPRHEKAVWRMLSGKGYESFLPLYTKRRQYLNRARQSELPLFPGYLFCRFCLLRRLPILTTPGVLKIIGVGRQPVPVDERELASLRMALQAPIQISPFPYLQVGQKVRIEDGPLVGIEGILVSIKSPFRLVISITLLQRSVLLEIDPECVGAERVYPFGMADEGHSERVTFV